MPIEFHCPSCAKLLRTPDESAGKKAKCPQCGTITDVPAASAFSSGSDVAPSPFGGGTPPSKPSPFESSPFESSSTNPYAPPKATDLGMAAATDDGHRPGLPWETEGKSLKTFWSTTKMILGSPTVAFGRMFREGGIGTPLVFALAGGATGGLFTGVYNTLVQLGMLSLAANAGGQQMPPGMTWLQVAIQLPTALAAGTIGVVIGSFFSSGLYHLFLMMLGGARYPYETTYRVVAYVTGATSLVQVIPLCGQYAAGLVALIYTILGFAEAHRISGGKASAAVLLPMILCVVVCGVGVAALVAFAVTQAQR